jgi:nucleotide-binding universal stress UspA family protein
VDVLGKVNPFFKKELSMKVDKILWPTDFSENSSKALPYVASLSQLYGAAVHVLYVLEEMGPFGAWYGDFDRSQIEALLKLQKEKAEEHLEKICVQNLDGCPLYVRHTATGDPASEILKLIDKEKPDMVVMSSRGKRGYFSLGAVAEKVVRHSPVPVLTVPVR